MTMQKPIVKSKDAPDLGVFSWSDPFYLEQQLAGKASTTRNEGFSK